MAVAVHDIADRLVADICGEFSAAAFQVARPVVPFENGPSNDDCVVGDCVASEMKRAPGAAAAAPPRHQSNKFLAWKGSSGIA